MIIDPSQLGGTDPFNEQVNQLVDFVRSCPTAEGVDEILLPGDPERKSIARHQDQGFSIDDENWQQLATLAEKLGVSLPGE